jgi:hypothetical protein
MFISSTGQYCVRGNNKNNEYDSYSAIPPFIVHKQPSIRRKDAASKTVEDVEEENKKQNYTQGLFKMHENGEETNNFGFSVRTTPKGSMQQDIFLDYAVHFVNHLQPDQGKNKKPVILIMDGHNSCWTLNALHYLSENNVWTFFLLSHTSIVPQPNDCNINKDVH